MITNQAVVSVVCQHIHELTTNLVTIMLLLLFSLLGKLVGKAIIFCRIFWIFHFLIVDILEQVSQNLVDRSSLKFKD